MGGTASDGKPGGGHCQRWKARWGPLPAMESQVGATASDGKPGGGHDSLFPHAGNKEILDVMR